MRQARRLLGATLAAVLPLLPATTGCRRSESTPSVPGARVVLPLSTIRLFIEAPVSTQEFEDPARRAKLRVSPRFNDGVIHTAQLPDGTRVLAEAPPKMAHRNRGNDCGPSDQRRVCPVPWEEMRVTVCGRPLNGHVDIVSDRLDEGGIIVCRLIGPPPVEDGVTLPAPRDCTRAPRIPLRAFPPGSLLMQVGDVALVPDEGGGSSDTCARVEAAERR